jgi:STE24 endopeptidase
MSGWRVSLRLASAARLCITLAPLTFSLLTLSPPAQSLESPHASVQNQVQGYTLPPEEYARAVAYSRGGYWLYFVTTVYTLLILWAMVRWWIGPRLRDWAEKKSRRTWVQFLLFAPTLLLIFGVLLLPTGVYAQWLERKFGFSLQSWPSWLGDWATAEIATVVSGTLAVALVYFMMRRSPRRWWLYLWMITVPLVLVVVFIQPVVIDPLFNTFEPLDRTHPELVDTIEVLVGRAGLVMARDHVYLLKLGDKSTDEDAISEGFGPTKRIFITDAMIASKPAVAILPLVAHEIGHYRVRLDWIAFAIAVVLSPVLLYFIDRFFVRLVARRGKKWDIRGPGDWASLPVLALIVSLIAVALTPAVNGLSRYREHEADRCGLELIHGVLPNAAEAAAQAFQENAEKGLSDPDPPKFVRWWIFDHPPVNERIIFFRTYDPWSQGKEPRYVK